MEQFVQCVKFEFNYDVAAQAKRVRKESEICINTRYVVSAEKFEEMIADGDEMKIFSYYLITMHDGLTLSVKNEPHLMAVFGM